MNTKRILGTLLIAFLGGAASILVYTKLVKPATKIVAVEQKPVSRYANYPRGPEMQTEDFIYAAENSVHAVVHVMSTTMHSEYSGSSSLFEYFFGDRGYNSQPKPQVGYGSGVIVSANGYIVTNNHVVDNSDEIQVVLNDRRSFKAELIGTDPNTDLAVLKIEADEDFSFVSYGNSDHLKVGQWVLAVGNPFNLTSTVTAGIVSAKARSLNIIQQQMPIESFIQTDAAVNPGNSGGALVNTKGELVGINTAIASRTGSYSGYSFAIPSNLVQKVVKDLIEFGVVQRAILGVKIRNIDNELAEKENIKSLKGIYVVGVTDNGAAKEAGIQQGDIIIDINGVEVNHMSELMEQVAKYRPNDKIAVRVRRNNKEKHFDVTLRNMQGNTSIIKQNEVLLGAKLGAIPNSLKQKLRIRNGVQVIQLGPGKFKSSGIKEGFIVGSVNNKAVNSVEDMKNILEGYEGGVYVEGIYPDGRVRYYAFGLKNRD